MTAQPYTPAEEAAIRAWLDDVTDEGRISGRDELRRALATLDRGRAAAPSTTPDPAGLREALDKAPRLWLSGARLSELAVSLGNVTNADAFFVDFDEVEEFVAVAALDSDRAALATPAPLDDHHGEPHEFRTTCLRCGKPGMLHVSLITPEERVEVHPAARLAATEEGGGG